MNKRKIVLLILVLIILALTVLAGLYFYNFNGSDDQSSDGLNAKTSSNYGNISFNGKSMKLLDLSGYEEQWSEEFLPVFSDYGNWIWAPMEKNRKSAMILGLRNGQTREVGLNYAVSLDFKELAYGVSENKGYKIVIESIDDASKKWESPVFEQVFGLYYGPTDNFLNIIGIENNKTVWYVNKEKKAEFDAIKYLSSDKFKRSKDKTKVALIGLKNNQPMIVINGSEKVFENAEGIDLIGFPEKGNHVSYGVYYSKNDVGIYSDDKEIARNAVCNMMWAVPSPSGDRIACPPTGMGAPGNQFMKVLGENPSIFRKAYYELGSPSFSLDGKRLAYVVDTGKTSESGTKQFAVIDEKEEKQYDEVRNVIWGGNNTYAYVARETKKENGEIFESNFMVVNGIEQHKFSGKYGNASSIEPYKIAINPVNGKVGYVVCNSDVTTDESLRSSSSVFSNTVTDIKHRCFVIYDGKSQPEFGLISEKLQFTADGEHVWYSAASKDEKKSMLIIDGKVVDIDGSVWGEGRFSPDGKKIGFYVVRGNEYWWEVYNIEDLLKKAEVLPNKDLENVQSDVWKDVNDEDNEEIVIDIPEGWKKYDDKNFEIYYPAGYKEIFENKSFKISSSGSVYKKTSGVNMLNKGMEISNNETTNYEIASPQKPNFEKWASEKNKYLKYSLSKWPSDDFKTELSLGYYNGKYVPMTTMRWNNGDGACFSKDIFLYNPKTYIEIGFQMKTCGDDQKEVPTFEKMLSTFKFKK